MGILFSGDFHAGEVGELQVITRKSLIQKYGNEMFSRIKYHIILGDGGFMWQNNQNTDRVNYQMLNFRPFPILCVIGNHEPILGMNDLEEVDIGIGEKVYKINDKPFTAYLKRGKAYNIEGLKILVLGGALSVDKKDRKAGKTWWEKEYWTEDEKKNVMRFIETENEFDFVISHTGPDSINRGLFESIEGETSKKFNDEVAFLNDMIEKKISFREWWCGHWHQNLFHYDTEKNRGYQYLYKMTKIIERNNDGIVIYSENTNNKDNIRKYDFIN
jgi:3-oxoacid CoA-transferase subunit A